MKSLFKTALPAISISTVLISSSGAFGFRDPDPLDPKATDAATTVVTSKILESSQFAHRQLDDELARKFLDRYLDALDGAHLVFLKSDIEEFTKKQPDLAEATRKQGDSSLAHFIFKRYLERLDQRIAFIKEQLETSKFDFSSDDTFAYDRKDAPRPASLTEAKPLWLQQLRYEYLQEKLGGKKEAEIVKILSRRSERLAETMRKLNEKAVLEFYLEALAQVYDPHSDYMGPDQLKSFESDMNLSLIGIGASLRVDDGYCKIMELIPGGPAARSGLIKNGDRIVGVSQKQGEEFTDVIDLPINQSVSLIRGKKGTPVLLNIIPADAADDSVRKVITIIREEIKLEDQQAKAQVIEVPAGKEKQRIGIIDLPGFYAGEGDGKGAPTSATADVRKIITKLKEENVTGIILDLRRNGGGSLQESIDLTGLFIPSGPVVQTRSLEGRVEVGKDRDGKVLYDGPLVVLISRFSASASEIVAGALQDYGRALIVGDTATFGKGTVQTIVPLSRVMQSEGIIPGSDPGALKVTISKFYRPSGKSTQLEGVKADIVIPSLSDTPEIGERDLEDPLPWDTIEPAKYTEINRVSPALTSLQTRSSQRISADPDFADLKKTIAHFQKLRTDKSVSLNEATRQKEKDELKARNEKSKKERLARATPQTPAYEVTVKNYNKPGLTDLVKPKPIPFDPDAEPDTEPETSTPDDDIILKEAQRILIDYAEVLKG
jgi:carboxyl-terminal processing protease